MTLTLVRQPEGLRHLTRMIEDGYGRLAEATSLLQVKAIVDQATVLQDMAKVLGASIMAQNKATALRLEAEARAGELTAQLEKKPGRKPKVETVPDAGTIIRPKKEVLLEVGLSQQRAHELEQVAEIPKSVRDEYVGRCITSGEEISRAGLMRAATTTSGAADYDGDEWYTPPNLIERARTVLGEIDLDPASNAYAQKSVRAKKFYTKEDNGLSKPWQGRIFCNPPYSMPLIEKFTEKLIESKPMAAIYLVNNCTDAGWFHTALKACTLVCFTRGRIGFLNSKGQKFATRQGQAIFYFGRAGKMFVKTFSEIGLVLEVTQ